MWEIEKKLEHKKDYVCLPPAGYQTNEVVHLSPDIRDTCRTYKKVYGVGGELTVFAKFSISSYANLLKRRHWSTPKQRALTVLKIVAYILKYTIPGVVFGFFIAEMYMATKAVMW